MKQLKILLLSTMVVFFTACGGGSSTDVDDDINIGISYQVSTTDPIKTIALPKDEKIIAGYGCTYVNIYNSDDSLYGTTNVWDSDNITNPIALPQGEYKIDFREAYNHTGSIGILYYLSSNSSIPALPLDVTVSVPDRVANLYKLQISSTSSYVIDDPQSVITVYDSSLNMIGSTSAFSSDPLDDPLTLNAGVYYFISSPYSCLNGGTFTISTL